MDKEVKNDLIHIRIEHSVKEKTEDIFNRLGINMSYAVSLFLNQVILHDGFPFEIEIPKNYSKQALELARIIESTGGKGKISDKNKRILDLFSNGDIDYETALFAIKRSFESE